MWDKHHLWHCVRHAAVCCKQPPASSNILHAIQGLQGTRYGRASGRLLGAESTLLHHLTHSHLHTCPLPHHLHVVTTGDRRTHIPSTPGGQDSSHLALSQACKEMHRPCC